MLINTDRVRELCIYERMDNRLPLEMRNQIMLERMARELVSKLAEFQKFELIGDMVVCRLQIIVPETPEKKWP